MTSTSPANLIYNPPSVPACIPITRMQFLAYLICPSFYGMICLMVSEAALSAVTTYLVIQAGRHVADNVSLTADLLMILVAQSTAYVAGALSWYFAERAGFRAYGRYMLQFARGNREQAKLLMDKSARERVEPFLTSTAFFDIFNIMYEMESQLKLLLGLVFNTIVLGIEIDVGLPLAYGIIFTVLMALQWVFRKRVTEIYLENQRQNNRIVAHGYTAWENVFSGNKYNLRLWLAGFKSKLRDCLVAQVKAIMTREGLSAFGGIVGLAVVFTTMTFIAIHNAGDTATLIALTATLPRQIEMTNNMHEFASGWNDLLAMWTRLGGVVESMHPSSDPNFDHRIKFDQLVLREGDNTTVCKSVNDALALILAHPKGRITVRGGNGSGKSTLLATLKADIKNRAYYWPTTDRLAFQFATAAHLDEPEDEMADEDTDPHPKLMTQTPPGFSSGERQLKSLQEIVRFTDTEIYLLDEWDANLDAGNRSAADALIDELAKRARVVEISHRERM